MSNKEEKRKRKIIREIVGDQSIAKVNALVKKARAAVRRANILLVVVALLIPANIWAVVEIAKGSK